MKRSRSPLHQFDMKRLHATLDGERRARALSWVELTNEINKPFEGTPSIPIGVSTIRGVPTKSSVASTVVLQVLRWLRRTPESFLAISNALPRSEEVLPDPGPSRILRFDTKALYAALNAKRSERGLTWQQVAGELPGFTVGMLTNLSSGPLIAFPGVMILIQWLRLSAASFVRGRSR